MEFLDEPLKRPPRPVSPRVPVEHYYRRAYNYGISVSLFYYFVMFIRHRNDRFAKFQKTTSFYKIWLPCFILGSVIYPFDNYLWGKVDDQVKFWQLSIYKEERKPRNIKENGF
ncbi:unnamed protein product [Blepharisma stoltei]|uniref:Uncharacterized protein n=1 Tax=Blepharisma stoltei TaxID=1481888 RepID=A0AAU9JG62_9CILI|nr:unnamed protein product [Blepharisma stoltei]